MHTAAPLAPAPTLALLVERQPSRVIWIADGSASLYAVPTRAQQAEIVERVFDAADVCPVGGLDGGPCRHLEITGDGWNEPREADCAALFDGKPCQCPGYADELAAWEQEQVEALDDAEFAALTQVAA